ncbi:MAG: class I SAM-dependent methyltransferase [Pararhodobacter sp.]|nr:class I SAM-dependent methyltransferase [Pararhodobacter sp.]
MWNRIVDGFLRRFVRHGTLHLTFPDGTYRRYGSGAPEVGVALRDPALMRRLVVNPSLAAGEGYMNGTLQIENDDLHGFVELGLRNLEQGPAGLLQGLNRLLRDTLRGLQQYNPVSRAQRNVAHHYDLSGALYDLFLDTDRQYSCAYFPRPGMTLEEAQAAKKAHIAGKLLLQPGMRVLDIGCGWGGTALTLARDHDVRVLGVTLSQEQLGVARARARNAGLDDKVTFALMDYRALDGQFDRIVSVGMFEHVGVPHYRRYFACLRDRLADDGVALVHTIGRMSPPGSTNPWVARYIFPGGYIPALSEVMAAVEKESLWPCDIEIWRLHYAETLRHWHDRFMANIDRARTLYDDRFCRMWRFYLVGSEQTFRHATQGVFQIQLARRRDAVPLTRDYLYPAARGGDLRAAAE